MEIWAAPKSMKSSVSWNTYYEKVKEFFSNFEKIIIWAATNEISSILKYNTKEIDLKNYKQSFITINEIACILKYTMKK